MAKVLALTNDGRITYCSASEENRGKGRCPHLIHQLPSESEKEFITRAQTKWSETSTSSFTITTSRLTPNDVSETAIEAKYKDIAEGKSGQEYYIQLSEPVWNDADAAAYADHLIQSGKASPSSRSKLITETMNRAMESEESYRALNAEAEENGFATNTKVPILPEALRPNYYSETAGEESQSPLTKQYQKLYRSREKGFLAQRQYRELILGEKIVTKKNGELYTVPIDGGLKNFLDGGKSGFVRRELTGRAVPYTGRAVITPNAKLEMDEIAIPAPVAATIFKPTVTDVLQSKGYSQTEIDQFLHRCCQTKFRSKEEEIQSLTDQVRLGKILAYSEVRVIANRQPSLHYGSLQSFRPKIATGAAVQIPTTCCKQYAADFDGDTQTFVGINSVDIARDADTALGAKNMTQLPRHLSESAVTPTKEAMWGLMNIIRSRKK